eukprot:UN01963
MSNPSQATYTTAFDSNNPYHQQPLQIVSTTTPAVQESRHSNLHTGQIISLIISFIWFIITIIISVSFHDSIPRNGFKFCLMIIYFSAIYYPLITILTTIIAVIRCIQYPKWDPSLHQNVTTNEAIRSRNYHFIMLCLHIIFTFICLICCLIATPIITLPSDSYTPNTKGSIILVLFYILIGFFIITTALQYFIFGDAKKRLKLIQSSSNCDDQHNNNNVFYGDEQV